MSDALFRMVCVPAALDGWSLDMLRDGEVALLVDGGGLDAVTAVAHRLDAPTVRVVRSEDSTGRAGGDRHRVRGIPAARVDRA